MVVSLSTGSFDHWAPGSGPLDGWTSGAWASGSGPPDCCSAAGASGVGRASGAAGGSGAAGLF
ncbi:hypothetical protein [Gordonia amarae]|uniref:hypothetical protein n=1 Tax=Gordonia amarae TaxID=36821 RepID=UPI001AFA3107|nr:hypothetical protein [Gordonia amarae]QHN18284.1 hypothetical protein GII35_16115 [Gordonia amarae]